MNLTTLARYKAFKGISGTSQDALISAMLPLVSDQIARYLRRDLEATTYLSWVDGLGGDMLRLEQWPILAVYHVAVGAHTVARLSCPTSLAVRATTAFDGTSLSLVSVKTDGSMSPDLLPVATSKTIATLNAAAELKGWSATLDSPNYANEPSSLIKPFASRDALYPTEADIEVPEDPEPVRVVDDDCILRPDGLEFPVGIQTVFVWYKAGYTLPTDESAGTLPPGLEMVAFQILSDALASRAINSLLQSESLGDYSYSLRSGQGGAALASAIRNRQKDLNLFRKATL